MNNQARDPALSELLDHFTVPGLPADFADRVVAAAGNRAPALPIAMASRRGRRGRWLRAHRVAIGVAAFGLMSAAAAATAIFGDVARTVPVIGPIIASVVPDKLAARKQRAAFATSKPAADPGSGAGEAVSVEPVPISIPERRAIRRELVAERIADRLERRDQRRAELGLPPAPVRRAQAIRVLRRVPRAERSALVERVRELRAERRADIARAKAAEPAVDLRPAEMPLPSPRTDAVLSAPAAPGAASPAGPEESEAAVGTERAERLQRLRTLRALRERRRELRRRQMQ